MEERQTIIGIGPAATTKVINTDNWSMETSFNAKDLTTYLNSVDKYIERRTALINHAYGR
jgi:oxygen-independent coproporphyrinogen-3 oxidase